MATIKISYNCVLVTLSFANLEATYPVGVVKHPLRRTMIGPAEWEVGSDK